MIPKPSRSPYPRSRYLPRRRNKLELRGSLRHGAQGANVEGHTVVVKEEERPAAGNVINLMEASKRNIEGTAPAKGKRPSVDKKGEKAADGHPGLLKSDDCLAAGPCAA